MARTIGAVDLDDQVNAWFDSYDVLPWQVLTYASLLGDADGTLVPTRRARKASQIEVRGVWLDGGGRTWLSFCDELYAVDGGALVVDGKSWASCDVATVEGQRLNGIGPSGGEVRRWTVKVQPRSAVRTGS